MAAVFDIVPIVPDLVPEASTHFAQHHLPASQRSMAPPTPLLLGLAASRAAAPSGKNLPPTSSSSTWHVNVQ